MLSLRSLIYLWYMLVLTTLPFTLAYPPSNKIQEFPAIWAYDAHYRCAHELFQTPHILYELGIAARIEQTCQVSVRDRNPVRARLRYIGEVQRIICLTYASTSVNVLKC